MMFMCSEAISKREEGNYLGGGGGEGEGVDRVGISSIRLVVAVAGAVAGSVAVAVAAAVAGSVAVAVAAAVVVGGGGGLLCFDMLWSALACVGLIWFDLV